MANRPHLMIVAALAAFVLGLLPSAAQAQLTLTGAGRGGGGGAACVGLCLTYRGHYESATDATSYTSTASALGTASSDRVVIVALASGTSGANANFSAVTVGGVSATRIVNTTGGGSTRLLEMWFALVPSGSTGDIVVTASSTVQRLALDWWTITGTTQTTYAARNAANVEVNTNGGSISSTALTVPTGGVGIVAVRVNNTALPTTPVLTQSSGTPTTRNSGMVAGETQYHFVADANVAGSQSWTYSQAAPIDRNVQIAAISWGP